MFKGDHTSQHQEPAEVVEIICLECQTKSFKPIRNIKRNQGILKKKGPFCGKSCAGLWSRKQQLARGEINLRKEKNLITR